MPALTGRKWGIETGGIVEKNWQYQTNAQTTVTEEGIGNRRLWTAVLVSAVEDWCNGSLRRRRNAQEFLFDSAADFQTVCARAGVEPASFQTRLRKLGKIVEMHSMLAPFIPPIAA
jgi:hypothetical protein